MKIESKLVDGIWITRVSIGEFAAIRKDANFNDSLNRAHEALLNTLFNFKK